MAAIVALSIVMLSAWADRVLLDEDRFSGRVAATLQQDDMNRYLAAELTEQVVARAPELITVRPAVEAVLSEALRTRTAIVGARAALRQAHRGVQSGIREESIVIDLQAVITLASALMQQGAPEIAERFEAGLDTTRLDAAAVGLRTGLFERMDRLGAVKWPLAAASVLLVAGIVAVAPQRRGGLIVATASVGMAGVVGLTAQRLGGVWLAGTLPADEGARDAVTLVWRSLLYEYRGWNIGLLVVGLAGTVGVLASWQLPDGAAVRRRITGSRWGRTIGGASLALVGLAVTRWPLDTVRVITLTAGVVLAGGGAMLLLRNALAGLGDLRPAEYARRLRDTRLMLTVFAVATILGVTGILALWFDTAVRAEPIPVEPPPITVCNGHEILCDRPLDQVTFPATHNSMAAASERGWYFPSQRYGIAQQLREGIRTLLIDTYYAVPSAQGVRTVINSDVRRQELVEEHGAEVVEAAERIARRLAPGGDPEIFLCHSFCELGATPMADALVDIRDYLDANPGDFVVLFIQDTTSPEDTVREFQLAGLAERAYAHSARSPWPTLGELLADGKQLLVLAERDAGTAPWYQPAFALARATAFDTPSPAAFDCDAGLGEPDNPLFLLNHWISERPALPLRALEVNNEDFLRERSRACAEELGQVPNFVAVDFYDVGDLFAVVDELNGLPAATASERPDQSDPRRP